jgi:hypothetical protein
MNKQEPIDVVATRTGHRNAPTSEGAVLSRHCQQRSAIFDTPYIELGRETVTPHSFVSTGVRFQRRKNHGGFG